MEKSQHSQEILKLGKTLAQSFAQYERQDLTTAWMSHYLAALIKEAEEEPDRDKKTTLQKECADIILQLWSKKDRYSEKIDLFAGLEHAVAVIGALRPDAEDPVYWRRFANHENESPWGKYIQATRIAIDEILVITLSALVTKKVMDRQKKWKAHEELLSDTEREFMEFLDKRLEKKSYGLAPQVKIIFQTIGEDGKVKKEGQEKPEPKLSKMEMVFQKLRVLIEMQTDALNELEEQILRPEKKKRPDKKSVSTSRSLVKRKK